MDQHESFVKNINSHISSYGKDSSDLLSSYLAAAPEDKESISIDFVLLNFTFRQKLSEYFNKSVLAGEFYLKSNCDQFNEASAQFSVVVENISNTVDKINDKNIHKKNFVAWAGRIKKYFESYSRLIWFIETSIKYFNKEYYYHASFEDIVTHEEVEKVCKSTVPTAFKAFYLNLKLAELDNKLKCDLTYWRELLFIKNKLADLASDNPIDILPLLYSKCKYLISKVELRFSKTREEVYTIYKEEAELS